MILLCVKDASSNFGGRAKSGDVRRLGFPSLDLIKAASRKKKKKKPGMLLEAMETKLQINAH